MPEFKLTRYRIRTEGAGRGPAQPFSAVLLSDLHNDSYGSANSRLLQAIRSEKPEAVFVTGDMLTATLEPQRDSALALMDQLTKEYPVYYVNGNHESKEKKRTADSADARESYSEAIRGYGVHLLENSCVRTEIRRMPVTIWGLELPLDYYQRFRRLPLDAEQVAEFLGGPDEGRYNILLAHQPLYFDAYARWGADLTLSGHLHGGLVRLPYLGGVVSPQFSLFPRYDRGLYAKYGRKLVVSAGLGGHSVLVRVNNPPELVVLDFT